MGGEVIKERAIKGGGESPPGTPATVCSEGDFETHDHNLGGHLQQSKRYSLRVVGDELRCPPTAWPTIALFLAALSGYLGTFWWSWREPGLKTVPFMAVCNYILFTPLHDSAHRSVSKEYRWLNELVGYISACAFQAPFKAFRFLHLEHHKYTNDPERDPDMWSGGNGSLLLMPFFWATQSWYYYYHYLVFVFQRPLLEVLEVIASGAVYISTVVTAISLGYGTQMLYLLLCPKLIAECFLAYSFDYAPHRPHEVLREEDIYKCTAMMAGLLSPEDRIDLSIPLLYQNFHNVHHLYPMIPFYRYTVVWARHKDALLRLGTPVTSWYGGGKSMAAVHNVVRRIIKDHIYNTPTTTTTTTTTYSSQAAAPASSVDTTTHDHDKDQ